MKQMNAIFLTSMQEIQKQVDVLHTISIICLVFAVLLLIAAIVEFFLLDIFKIILIKTGRAARMGIKELEAENAESGRLLERKKKKGHNMWNTAAPLERPQNAGGQAVPVQNAAKEEGAEGITLLENAGAGDTSLLEGMGSNETTLLEQGGQYDYSNANITMPLEEEAPVKIGRFIITKNIMMIHTDEAI